MLMCLKWSFKKRFCKLQYFVSIIIKANLCSEIFAELGDAFSVHSQKWEDFEEPLHRRHILAVHCGVKLALHNVLQLLFRLVQQLERGIQSAAWNWKHNHFVMLHEMKGLIVTPQAPE